MIVGILDARLEILMRDQSSGLQEKKNRIYVKSRIYLVKKKV